MTLCLVCMVGLLTDKGLYFHCHYSSHILTSQWLASILYRNVVRDFGLFIVIACPDVLLFLFQSTFKAQRSEIEGRDCWSELFFCFSVFPPKPGIVL